MNQILLIHKTADPKANDVQINITELNNGGREVCQNEGVAIADVLWATLPAVTVDALMTRLWALENERIEQEKADFWKNRKSVKSEREAADAVAEAVGEGEL